MEIGDWMTTPRLAPQYRELRACGLEGNVAELEAFGFTVVPPNGPASPPASSTGSALRFWP